VTFAFFAIVYPASATSQIAAMAPIAHTTDLCR
jgi:hypothetical protein